MLDLCSLCMVRRKSHFEVWRRLLLGVHGSLSESIFPSVGGTVDGLPLWELCQLWWLLPSHCAAYDLICWWQQTSTTSKLRPNSFRNIWMASNNIIRFSIAICGSSFQAMDVLLELRLVAITKRLLSLRVEVALDRIWVVFLKIEWLLASDEAVPRCAQLSTPLYVEVMEKPTVSFLYNS